MRSTISSVTFWTLAAMSQWNCSMSDSADVADRLAEELGEALVGHGQPVVVGEVLHVELEGAVLAEVDQLVQDLSAYLGSP